MNTQLIIIILIIVIGGFYYYLNFCNKPEQMTTSKVIKYFGGDYCPHSNKESRTYKLIHEDFAEKYPDVIIKDYWSEPENRQYFEESNVEIVPTITNSNNTHIRLELPNNTNPDEYTDEELHILLLENVYNQLK